MSEDARLWYVTVTLSGTPMEPLMVRGALQRLTEQRPFLTSLRYAADRAEVSYWDEADELVDVASLALRLWNEHREAAQLPAWQVTGLEVVEQDVRTRRQEYDTLNELQVLPRPL